MALDLKSHTSLNTSIFVHCKDRRQNCQEDCSGNSPPIR